MKVSDSGSDRLAPGETNVSVSACRLKPGLEKVSVDGLPATRLKPVLWNVSLDGFTKRWIDGMVSLDQMQGTDHTTRTLNPVPTKVSLESSPRCVRSTCQDLDIALPGRLAYLVASADIGIRGRFYALYISTFMRCQLRTASSTER